MYSRVQNFSDFKRQYYVYTIYFLTQLLKSGETSYNLTLRFLLKKKIITEIHSMWENNLILVQDICCLSLREFKFCCQMSCEKNSFLEIFEFQNSVLGVNFKKSSVLYSCEQTPTFLFYCLMVSFCPFLLLVMVSSCTMVYYS